MEEMVWKLTVGTDTTLYYRKSIHVPDKVENVNKETDWIQQQQSTPVPYLFEGFETDSCSDSAEKCDYVKGTDDCYNTKVDLLHYKGVPSESISFRVSPHGIKFTVHWAVSPCEANPRRCGVGVCEVVLADLQNSWSCKCAAGHHNTGGNNPKCVVIPSPPPGCTWECYVSKYPDLKIAVGSSDWLAADHYQQHGISEGRSCLCPTPAPTQFPTRRPTTKQPTPAPTPIATRTTPPPTLQASSTLPTPPPITAPTADTGVTSMAHTIPSTTFSISMLLLSLSVIAALR